MLTRSRKPLARSPLKRRAPLRYKRKVAKKSWRSGQTRIDAAGLWKLRGRAFQRSGGKCECWIFTGGAPCGKRVDWQGWWKGEMHHIVPVGRGGSDVLRNVAYIAPTCHGRIHGEPQWSKSA